MNIDQRVAGMKFLGRCSFTNNLATVQVTFDHGSGQAGFLLSCSNTVHLTPASLDGLIDALTEWRDRYKERARSKARRAKETKHV